MGHGVMVGCLLGGLQIYFPTVLHLLLRFPPRYQRFVFFDVLSSTISAPLASGKEYGTKFQAIALLNGQVKNRALALLGLLSIDGLWDSGSYRCDVSAMAGT